MHISYLRWFWWVVGYIGFTLLCANVLGRLSKLCEAENEKREWEPTEVEVEMTLLGIEFGEGLWR